MDIRAIIFDFGGVMEPFPKATALVEQEVRRGLAQGSLAELLWASPEWRQAEVGAITDEEYWRRIGAYQLFRGKVFDRQRAFDPP